jgi:hypothetical protein
MTEPESQQTKVIAAANATGPCIALQQHRDNAIVMPRCRLPQLLAHVIKMAQPKFVLAVGEINGDESRRAHSVRSGATHKAK